MTDNLPMLTLLACSLLWLQSTTAPPSATVKIFGAVARPTTFSAAEIAAMLRMELRHVPRLGRQVRRHLAARTPDPLRRPDGRRSARRGACEDGDRDRR